ncbi:MAG: hypothetical protein ACHQIM_11125 [Sphingobacteriales bacterium]
MLQYDRKIYYTLRFAAAMCFIGHGAFGIITKEIWCNYFGVFGIGRHMAYTVMPWVGIADILMGVSLLLYPTRAVMVWLFIWGIVTAFLRPMSGEPFAEFVERAGNYGVPAALLILYGGGGSSVKGWFTRVGPDTVFNRMNFGKAVNSLKVVTFLLLTGHGWLNLIEKKGLMGQYASLGFSNPAQVAHIIGIFEIAAAFTVLIRPMRPLLLVFFIWKVGSELFYPSWELFEWIERGGSYGALLALWFALASTSLRTKNILITALGGLVAWSN